MIFKKDAFMKSFYSKFVDIYGEDEASGFISALEGLKEQARASLLTLKKETKNDGVALLAAAHEKMKKNEARTKTIVSKVLSKKYRGVNIPEMENENMFEMLLENH